MDGLTELRIPISGLGCGGGGATTLERELASVAGVRRVYVNPATEMAYVSAERDAVDILALLYRIDQAGYRAGRPVRA